VIRYCYRLQNPEHDAFEVRAGFDLQDTNGVTVPGRDMTFEVDLVLSFYGSEVSRAQDACAFPSSRVYRSEEQAPGDGHWTTLVAPKNITAQVQCRSFKTYLHCQNTLLLSGDMHNFKEYGGIEVVATTVRSLTPSLLPAVLSRF